MRKHSDIDSVLASTISSSSWLPEIAITLSDSYWGRQTGLPVCNAARDYCHGVMQKIGLQDVHIESYEFPGYRRGETRLKMKSPYNRVLHVESLLYSPSCDITGQLVFVDDIEKDGSYFVREKCKDKIILSTGNQYKEAASAGAAALIWYNDNQEGGLISLGKMADRDSKDWHGPLPGVSISREDALFLRRTLEKEDVQISLSIKGSFLNDVGWNVVGDLPGKEYDDRLIVLGSHYDGFDCSSSATDNASGVAVALGAMKALSKVKDKLKRRVRCILFSGEELGLLGSTNYVREHKEDLDRIDFMMNTDCSGICGDKALRLHAWSEQLPAFRRLLSRMDMREDGSWYSYRSDHFPFWASGCSTAYGFGGANPNSRFQHTTADTADKLQPDGIRLDAFLTAKLLFMLSSEDGWDIPRRNKVEVISELEQLGVLAQIKKMPFSLLVQDMLL